MREHIDIRRDKNTSNEELCALCLKSIVNEVNQDTIREKEFSKKEIKINKSVEEYFHDDLYTYLDAPKFNMMSLSKNLLSYRHMS